MFIYIRWLCYGSFSFLRWCFCCFVPVTASIIMSSFVHGAFAVVKGVCFTFFNLAYRGYLDGFLFCFCPVFVSLDIFFDSHLCWINKNYINQNLLDLEERRFWKQDIQDIRVWFGAPIASCLRQHQYFPFPPIVIIHKIHLFIYFLCDWNRNIKKSKK